MRAQCEACSQFQPPDWKAGDLCSFCGKAVRHDVRCYWCAKWVPQAKFCRSCGAAVVEERLYGAARMLKDAGTDRFTVPKQLKEFDPDQLENFSRIYQRHAIAVARHVDEARFAERFLRQKHWSAALEDTLVAQLPWPEDTLAKMSAPARPPGDDLATLTAIGETTPFGATKSLTALARLRLDDWKAYKDAASAFHSGDPTIKAESALALTTWRVLTGYGRPRDLGRELLEELLKSTFTLEAAVALSLLGGDHRDKMKDALASPDRIISFGAAIVTGDVDRLQGALGGDELEKIAASNKLISLGIIKPIVAVVEKSPLEVQQEIVESLIRRKEPAPEAADTLMGIVETTPDKTLRERAARILCRQINPAWVLRIARAAKEDRSIYQSLLQAPGLPPESALELGDFLIANGRFSMHQYGMSTLAENGGMPASFVPTRFARADETTRAELLRFAETQLEHRKNEELHKFVMTVVFGPYPAKTRAAAWWTLHRWYRSLGEHRGEGPFKLQKDVIVRFFGSIKAFLPKLAAVLVDRDTLKEVGYYEMIAHLLTSADDETVAAIQEEGSPADELVAALVGGMKGDYWPNTVEGMFRLLAQVGGHPRWRDQSLKALRSLGKKGNYHYDKALRRLELSAYGIPEESEWDALPLDFVPSRFGEAPPEGRLELLKVVEHQLIHKKTDAPDRGLLRLLLTAALTPGDDAVRSQAIEIHHERARERSFRLKKKEVSQAFGPFSEFVALLPDALRDPGPDPRLLDFLGRLFHDPEDSDAALIAGEGDAGRALIDAMLEVAGNKPKGSEAVNLCRDIVRYLGHAGSRKEWRDDVVAALDRVGATKGSPVASDCGHALARLRPPATERPDLDDAPRPQDRHIHAVRPARAAPPPPVIDYAEKGRIAQKMGAELQAAILMLMAGPGTPEEKMKEATRMSEEYQVRIKALYNS